MDCNISFFPFIGWRVWKMRNNFIFNGKREWILNIIARGLADYKEWIEVQKKTNNQQEHQPKATEKPKPKSVDEVFQLPHPLFCFVDSSWLSNKDKAGIG